MLKQFKDPKEWKGYHQQGFTKNFLVDYKNNIIYMPAYIRAKIKKIKNIEISNAKMDLEMKIIVIIDYTDLTINYIKPQDKKIEQERVSHKIEGDGRPSDDNLENIQVQKKDKFPLNAKQKVNGKQQTSIKQLILQKIKKDGIIILKDQNQSQIIRLKNPTDNQQTNQLIFEQSETLKMDMAYDGLWYPFEQFFLYKSLEFREFKPHQESIWKVRFNLLNTKQKNQLIVLQGQIFEDGYVIGDKLLHIDTDHYSIMREDVLANWSYYLNDSQVKKKKSKLLSLKTTTKKKKILFKPVLRYAMLNQQQRQHYHQYHTGYKQSQRIKTNVITDNYGFANIVIGIYKKPTDTISVIFAPLWSTVAINMAIFSMNNVFNDRIYSIIGALIVLATHMNSYRQKLPYTSYNLLFIEYLIYALMFTSILALGQTVQIHLKYSQEQGKPETHFQFQGIHDPWFAIAVAIQTLSITLIVILFLLHFFYWQQRYTKFATCSLIWHNFRSFKFWKKIITTRGKRLMDIFRNIFDSQNLKKAFQRVNQNKKTLFEAITLHEVQYNQLYQFDQFCWSNQESDQFFKRKQHCHQLERLIPIQGKNLYLSDTKNSANHFSDFHPQLKVVFTNGKAVLKFIPIDQKRKEKKISKDEFNIWRNDLQKLLQSNQIIINTQKKLQLNYKEVLIEHLLLPKYRSSILTFQEHPSDKDITLQAIFDHNPYVLHGFDYGQANDQFNQQDLWQLLYILVKQATMFHENQLGKLGNIKPENIFLVGQSLKIRCKYSWPGADKIDPSVSRVTHPEYLSPEQFSQIQPNKNTKEYQSLSQSFSIGLTILDIIVKTDYSRRFYNKAQPHQFMKSQFEKQQINFFQFFKKISDKKFIGIILGMLQYQTQNRYSCLEVYDALKKKEIQIMNCYYFQSEQIELGQKIDQEYTFMKGQMLQQNYLKNKNNNKTIKLE